MEKDYLLKKWLNNQLNEDERLAYEASDEFLLHDQIIKNVAHFKASHFSEMPSFETIENRLLRQGENNSTNWRTFVMRVAAILVVGVGLYYAFTLNGLTTVQTLAAEKTMVELPDTSEVQLNALTTISFSESDWKDKRELNLDGEAYFKVAKGQVFDVLTSDGVVTVVGTQFNVKQRENFFEVICYEGVVKVSTSTQAIELRVGDSFRRTDSTSSTSKTDKNAPSWTQNASYFNSVPYWEVIDELERQYNITINYSKVHDTILFSGGFTHHTLSKALNAITQPLGLTYKIDSSNNVSILNNAN